MKNYFFLILLFLFGISSVCMAGSVNKEDFYKLEMQNLIGAVRSKAKLQKPDFGILCNGGINIYNPNAYEKNNFVNAEKAVALVDGILVESLNYGFDYEDGAKTPVRERRFFLQALEYAKKKKIALFNIDYCTELRQKSTALRLSRDEGFINYAAKRELDNLTPTVLNGKSVRSLKDCESFCVLLNPHKFKFKEVFLERLRNSNYDLLIIDGYFGDAFLTAADINSIKVKPNGRQRLVYCYMSIGEAEDYRWYWKQEYGYAKPEWLDAPNENWQGNYKVKYWLSSWHEIIYDSEDSYLSKIVGADFDGAFLDVIDAFEYFEGGN